jgi:predicted GIY-YIG superfamily endonuclease
MLVKKGGCVYIITNKIHTVLYVGVTRYNCDKLVWYERLLLFQRL